MQILLVEPDKLLASSTIKGLKKLGAQVEWSQNAQGAIHSIDTFRPEVIVLELQIPAHNGVEFLYELRSYSDWQNIPVVIYSFIQSEKLTKYTKSLAELGIDTWLYKPTTSLQQLFDILQTKLTKVT